MVPLGVNLTPIIVKEVVDLDAFRGRTIAVDAFNVLYQFLALIRTREGRPLSDSEGRVTSHLVGLAFRTTRLIADHGMKLVFVFDGSPPLLKRREVEKRREVKRKAEEEYKEAVEAYDLLDGERLTIDLTPTNKSFISSFFGSRPDAILAGSDTGEWSLIPGDNDITCLVSAAGGATVTAWLQWRDQYNGID
jgi:flap endonuclease-1